MFNIQKFKTIKICGLIIKLKNLKCFLMCEPSSKPSYVSAYAQQANRFEKNG